MKRRCLYRWIDYLTFEKEMEIVGTRLPAIEEELSTQLARFIQSARLLDLEKPPGVAEILDFAKALQYWGRRLGAEVIKAKDRLCGEVNRSK